MSNSRLNKILYNYEIIDTAESIITLEPYMVGNTELPINSIIQENEQEPTNTPVLLPNNTGIRTDKFFPKQDDTLFWSVFIAHYGLKEFYNVDRYKNREIEEKVKIVDFLKTLSKTDPVPSKHLRFKITKTSKQEMMGELMVAKNTTLFIVNALCVYYKMNLLFVYENTYLEYNLEKLLINIEGEIPTGIIYKNEAGSSKYNKYSVDLHVTPEKLKDIQNTKLRLEKYDKPLMGLSTYKITELVIMLRKLEPNLGDTIKKSTKKEIYERIYTGSLGFATIQ